MLDRIKRWLPVMGMGLIFVAGMAAGSLLTLRFAANQIRDWVDGGPEAVTARIVDVLDRRLNLETEQRDKIREILARHQDEIRQARERFSPEIRRIVSEANAEIRDQLQPRQREKFDRIAARISERWDRGQRKKKGGPKPKLERDSALGADG